MRRMLLAAAAVVGFSAVANAQWNQPPAPSQPGPNMYGWNPCFKKLLWWKKDSCGPSGCGKGGYGNGGAGAYGNGAGMPGTLVFPQNPYIRSPRDFFMYEAGR